ncbi:SPOR domain-containing protein [Halothiobacillus diazotrophicus]|uniref:SPOR domain-containing protein n=1 Tax=Halothiobacillus diazotrophicus TaxID=1860122 RepID=UPI0012E86899|nr:SPOR domain-containing protein [Halothiobacillus diazotrophicus]
MSEQEMQQNPVPNRLRQRLLGALVVVALAVLILPPWMDGGGLKTPAVLPVPATPAVDQPPKISVPAPTPEQQAALSHPPAPFLPADEPKSPQSPAPIASAAAPASDTSPVNPPSAASNAPQPQSPSPSSSSSSGSSVPALSPTSPAPEAEKPITAPVPTAPSANPVKSHNDSASTPADSGAPAKSASNGGQEWVVQLGSFSDELNARGLAKSVTDAGFKVDIYPLFAKKGTVWRVRVGPFATREQAVKSTIQLRERLGRDGLVMPK